jgi:hypothetical protein
MMTNYMYENRQANHRDYTRSTSSQSACREVCLVHGV